MTFPNKPAPALDGRPLTEVAAIRGASGDHAPSEGPITSRGTNGGSPRLPVYVRYRDLVEANIVTNWPQLLRLIEIEGFPRGICLSPNARAWEIGEVRDWLASRPQAGQVGAERRAAMPHADAEKVGPRRREGSGRACPLGKPRKAPGSDPSEEETQHDR